MVDFGEFHDELRSVARDLLGEHAPQQGDGTAPPAVAWSRLADAGWLGLEVPEHLGGSEATFAEVAVILEELGRSATAGPYVGTAVLGVGALLRALPSAERDALLREVAAGASRLTVALPGATAPASRPAGTFRLDEPSRLGDTRGGGVHGEATFVVDAMDADVVLVPASGADDRPVVVALRPASAGVRVSAQPVLDPTRQFGIVSVDAAELAGAPILELDDADGSFRWLADRAALAVALDSLGVAGAMLDATVAYAGVRMQFGRPIGSFQAVKHACADMLVQVSVSRELVAEAVRQIVESPDTAAPAISMAKSYACSAAVEVVGKAMQLHGGIGYTWESGIHVYLKRATLDRSWFGSPFEHRRRLSQRFVERVRDGDPATPVR